MPQSSKPTRRTRPPSESVWFWSSVFSVAALIALTLLEPKYRWRQPQLERQFQAREYQGASESDIERIGPQVYSSTGNAKISLRPLYAILAVILAFTWGMWLRERFSDRGPSPE